jgi:hypothetical protein
MESPDRCSLDAGNVRLGACRDHSSLDGKPRDLAGGNFGESRRHHRMDQQGYIRSHSDGAKRDFDVTILPKKTVTLVLKKAGAIDYYCRFHPNMKATLTVAP